jgi:hypothetical protein
MPYKDIDKEKAYHKEYGRLYRQKHKEYFSSYLKEYRKTHKAKLNEYNKQYKTVEYVKEYYKRKPELYGKTARKLREKFLQMYGNKCECCGETEPIFLAIDHVKGQRGISKKESGANAYRKAVKDFLPDTYRILCHNCNMATRWGKVCPHESNKD